MQSGEFIQCMEPEFIYVASLKHNCRITFFLFIYFMEAPNESASHKLLGS